MSEKSGFWSRILPKRPWVQFGFLVLANSWFTQNITKGMPCLGFNCYACPLAVFSCPIGSLQHFAGIKQVPFYLLGVLGLVGALGGRVACGWLCPFGWLQEQLFKIPLPKWAVRPRKRAPWWVLLLVSLGYAAGVWGMVAADLPEIVLAFYLIAGFVLYAWLGASRLFALAGVSLLLPFFTLEPWFSKLCPAGMLEGGIPQVLLDADLRPLIGPFFGLKLLILVFFLGWMAVTRRPFCRWICPLGTIWSPFNRYSTLQLRVEQEACIRCDRCLKVCPVEIRIYENETDPACIRCMECVDVCLTSCIQANSLLGGS